MVESDDSVLEVYSVSKRFGDRQAVSSLSFTVEPGQIYGLLGPNGAGKTTTIGIVAQVLKPDEGAVRIGAPAETARAASIRKLIGFVPQDLALYPTLTAEENLRLFAELYEVSRGELEPRLDELMELAGLRSRRKDTVATFSGGMKRRLNLVCGLIHRPRLLLLDEPTVGVDPQSRDRLFQTVRAQAEQGLSILYTTHYMEEAERLCDRIGIMDDGRLIAEGTCGELLNELGGGRLVTMSFERSPDRGLSTLLSQLNALSLRGGRFRLEGEGLERAVQEILAIVSSTDNAVRELEWTTPNLEDVFLHLTGHELRD